MRRLQADETGRCEVISVGEISIADRPLIDRDRGDDSIGVAPAERRQQIAPRLWLDVAGDVEFGADGTDALESEMLWDVPEIKRAGGFKALRRLGKPADVMREAKVRLFGV